MPKAFGCSGLVRPRTGIGVVQRKLYPILERSLGEPLFSPGRDLGFGLYAQAIGLVKGFLPPRGKYKSYLSIVPPLPLLLKGNVVSVIHDLRWMRTKGPIGRCYRKWDLWRTVRRSSKLICISDKTYSDLIGMFPSAAVKAKVSWLGPGIITGDRFTEAENGIVLLVGGAEHKRNLEAVKLLAEASPAWLKGFIGVGVSKEVREFVTQRFGQHFGRWESGLSDDEMVEIYQESQFFMMLGTDEGFGLPYIEALAAGCQLVVADQPLTRELLGSSATYLDTNANPAEVLRSMPHITSAERKSVLSQFSWERFAEDVRAELQGASIG